MCPQRSFYVSKGPWPTKWLESAGILDPSAASIQKRTLFSFSNSENVFHLWLGISTSLSLSLRQLLPSAKWRCSVTLVSLTLFRSLEGGPQRSPNALAPLCTEMDRKAACLPSSRTWEGTSPTGSSREPCSGGYFCSSDLVHASVLFVCLPTPPLADKLLWEQGTVLFLFILKNSAVFCIW